MWSDKVPEKKEGDGYKSTSRRVSPGLEEKYHFAGVRRNIKNLWYLPTKFILGVDVFLAAIFVGTADTLVLDVLLRDEFPGVVRPFTEDVAIDEVFTVQLLAAMLEGEAVGFEADTAVEEVAWLTTFGSVEGMGLPSFVCNLTTYKIKAHSSVRKLEYRFLSLPKRHCKIDRSEVNFPLFYFFFHMFSHTKLITLKIISVKQIYSHIPPNTRWEN